MKLFLDGPEHAATDNRCCGNGDVVRLSDVFIDALIMLHDRSTRVSAVLHNRELIKSRRTKSNTMRYGMVWRILGERQLSKLVV